MPDPFKLFGRMFVMCIVTTGYVFVFIIQSIWYVIFGKFDKIGDAFGYLGRKVADEFGGLFRR